MPTDQLSPRRRALLDAAVEVIARQGLRGLTHRAVDRQAGLPEGSCSAYLRTRQALQTALAEYVAASLAADVETLAGRLEGCDGVQPAIDLTAGLFLRWLGSPALLQARLELALEATRDPDLAAILTSSRERLVAIVAPVMTARGHREAERRAEVLVGSLDGVLLAALVRPRSSRKRFLTASLDLLMGGLAGHELT